jgi:hypothetical protein
LDFPEIFNSSDSGSGTTSINISTINWVSKLVYSLADGKFSHIQNVREQLYTDALKWISMQIEEVKKAKK